MSALHRCQGARQGRRNQGRRRASAGSVLVAVGLSVASFVATTVQPAAADQIVVVEGRGFGHGVGMAQDGAYWMGKSGRSVTDILNLFYPGTAIAKRTGTVRVPLLSAGSITLGFPNGGRIGSLSVAPGQNVSVRAVGGGLVATLVTGGAAAPAVRLQLVAARLPAQAAPQQVDVGVATTTTPTIPATPATPTAGPGTTTTAPAVATPASVASAASPPPAPETGAAPSTTGVEGAAAIDETTTTTAPPTGEPQPSTTDAASAHERQLLAVSAKSGVVSIGPKRYRGTLELTASGGIRVVNELDVEDYLRGMGEVRSPDWPAAALQAQAIAARTYAFRTMAAVGEVCPGQRCQVYLGAQAEYSEMDAAVLATRTKVLAYQGRLATTFYSASGGGTIATPQEAFGGGDAAFPYLRAGSYPTGDVKAWTVRFSLGEAGRRLGYPGTVQAIGVTRVGPSGRAVEVTVDGDRGPRTVAGPKVDAAWGLRSTFFTITTTTGTADSSLDTPTVDPVDLRAQSGVLAWADPPFTTDATADDSQTSDAAPDTTGARAAASTPTGDPNERVGRRADAAAPSARSAQSAPGRNGGRIAASGATTPADSKADLFIGAAVVAGVVASIAAVRRRRRR